MLDQIYRIQKLTGERVSNVVVMGSGEPLDNYDNLLVFLRMLTDENGLNISQRNVTVSTCGIVPKMYELAEEKLQITLALSLHATTDEKRRRLMPIANKYGMKELMDACRNYADKTGRRLTFEYSLVGGVNDTREDAEELIGLAAIFLPIGVMLGYTHEHLIALIVMLGSASTVSCFVMAKNMGHDGTLTSSVVVLTTLFSALTMTGWLFIFRTMGLV
jgi:wyosine [tRNA(Phe)-imidazoG37] synthetase (radical SAM superfamily)